MICSGCKADKSPEEFNWRNKSQGIRKHHCRTCDRAIKKKFYEAHKEQVKQEVKQRKQQKSTQYKEWKEQFSCSVCGEDDECCLDFHHLNPEEKENSISSMIRDKNWDIIMEEVKKCIVVCKNCHAKIHKYGLSKIQSGLGI